MIELARALCSEPKLILLDEPSSGLNVEETGDMSFWIRDIRSELGITVLMVEHDMSLVSRVSIRALALNYGSRADDRDACGGAEPSRGHRRLYRRGSGRGDAMGASDIILKVTNIESYYGPIMAIRGISLEVPRG